MSKILYKRYELHIDPTFWHSLYTKKLDEWKLDTSEKFCKAVTQANSIFLERSSLESTESLDSNKNRKYLNGIIRVFNTRMELQNYFQDQKSTLLKSSSHDFLILVHADLKKNSFDYYFALPTIYPSIPFTAYEINEPNVISSSSISKIDHNIVKERQCFILPEIIRNVIFKEYKKGIKCFTFRNGKPEGFITISIRCQDSSKVKYTGWYSTTLTTIDMSRTMNLDLITEQNAELNLKLMMWKHDPHLPLKKLRNINCLLIGSGTVGCSIARNLIAWGIRNITFVDCANVACSNPVRQNLYTVQCIGKEKATSAAQSLRDILPSVNAEGYTIDIPMPGHRFIGNEKEYKTLEELIKKSDVIFLSTDSREGRWLPILLAQIYERQVINVALGYESLVIQNIEESTACYFCLDPIGPRDTMSSRTIDEKCTITRPGISYIASALAVEFYVDLLRGISDYDQIRFSLSDMEFKKYTTSHSKNPICTCCSDEMISALSDKGYEFIENVKLEPSVLEELSGYTEEYGNIMENGMESMSEDDNDNVQ